MTTNLKIEDVYPSKYLSGGDLPHATNVTIKNVEVAEFKQKDGSTEKKPVMEFQEPLKLLVVNKTNFKACAKMFGDGTAGWQGKTVRLVPVEVEVAGEHHIGVRIREPEEPKQGGLFRR